MCLGIQGVMCEHSEARTKKAMEVLPEVESAKISRKDRTAVVTLSARIDGRFLKEAVEAQDFPATKAA